MPNFMKFIFLAENTAHQNIFAKLQISWAPVATLNVYAYMPL